MIVFSGWTLPAMRGLNDLGKGGPAQYKGPGLAMEWVELEGPLDAWPPAGYQRLFGDVPLLPKSEAKLAAEGNRAAAGKTARQLVDLRPAHHRSESAEARCGTFDACVSAGRISPAGGREIAAILRQDGA